MNLILSFTNSPQLFALFLPRNIPVSVLKDIHDRLLLGCSNMRTLVADKTIELIDKI